MFGYTIIIIIIIIIIIQLHSFFNSALYGGEWYGHFASVVKGLWYPLNRKLHGDQNRAGCFGKEIKILAIAGIKLQFLGRPISSLITIPTELPWSSFLL